jgi:hypothetical protein
MEAIKETLKAWWAAIDERTTMNMKIAMGVLLFLILLGTCSTSEAQTMQSVEVPEGYEVFLVPSDATNLTCYSEVELLGVDEDGYVEQPSECDATDWKNLEQNCTDEELAEICSTSPGFGPFPTACAAFRPEST